MVRCATLVSLTDTLERPEQDVLERRVMQDRLVGELESTRRHRVQLDLRVRYLQPPQRMVDLRPGDPALLAVR